jgi:hypothetical protein
MTQKPDKWVDQAEMERDGFTLDHDIDDIPSFAPDSDQATGLGQLPTGESSPPSEPEA